MRLFISSLLICGFCALLAFWIYRFRVEQEVEREWSVLQYIEANSDTLSRPQTHKLNRPGFAGSLEAVEFATLEWVDWFNNRRLLEPIGNIPPAEAEAAYYASLEEPAKLAA